MNLQNNFRLNVIFRILLIVAFALILAWVLANRSWFFTPLVISIIIMALVFNLITYVERTNKNLTQFLMSVKQGGFTNLFKDKKHGGTHANLNEVFNEVLLQFQQVTLEKESHYQYLQTLNENLGVSLISYNEAGKVELMNPAAKILLNKPYLRSIEDLKKINNDLFVTIHSLQSDEKRVIKTIIQGAVVQLSVQVKDFIAQEQKFRLVLLQNIHNELEEIEVEAWQKLISVLTHEIMNSVTPIASLSTAMNQMLEGNGFELDEEDSEDFKISLMTIENRSKGLMRFVNAYKDFTKVPDLSVSKVDLKKLTERVTQLLLPDLQKSNIEITVNSTKSDCIVKGDQELIEQVIINLIKNAIEVLDTKGQSKITVSIDKRGRTHSIQVADNGPGIDQETLDKIFVPFFTTKKKGTGIGLSFARQIMRLHNGSITVKSEKGHGTTFTLWF